MSKRNRIVNIKQTSNIDEWVGAAILSPKKQIKENMIKGYQEMAEINLRLSEFCFEAEREVEQFFEQIAECE